MISKHFFLSTLFSKPLGFASSLWLRKGAKFWAFVVFFLGLSLYGWLLWPAQLNQFDEQRDYKNALTLTFDGINSPLFFLLWHGLEKIWSGAGATLILILNHATLWAACALGVRLLWPHPSAFFMMTIPFWPWIFFEAHTILKDPVTGFGYVFLSMAFAYFTQTKKTLPSWMGVLFLCLIVYFTSCKQAQARFVMPVLLWWLAEIWRPHFKGWKKAGFWVALMLASFGAMHAVNQLEKKDTAHYWQYVKIYDLAGMCVHDKTTRYLPDFLWVKEKKISGQPDLERLNAHYDYLWEPLIRYGSSPLRPTASEAERDVLLKTWQKQVWAHPRAYLKHRTRLWTCMLKSSFSEMVKLFSRQSFAPSVKKNADIYTLPQVKKKIKKTIKQKIINTIYDTFFSFVKICFILCFCFSFINRKRNSWGRVAFFLSSVAFIWLAVLFIFTLAAAGRYPYLAWCCFLFALPFAWRSMGKKQG